jgi:hypothetical protein
MRRSTWYEEHREVSASVHDRTATDRTEDDILWTAAKIGPVFLQIGPTHICASFRECQPHKLEVE